MMSIRKITANRRNSRNSSGPRSAAGKSLASRNALRHGLAAVAHRQLAPSAEVERFAKAICANDSDPAILAAAVKIADNEFALQAIRAQQVAVIERLREPYAVPFAKRDNSLQLATARFMEAWLADRKIASLVPGLLEKYKDQMPPFLADNSPDGSDYGDLVPIGLKALLEEPASPEAGQGTLDPANKPIEEGGERDQYQALEAAVLDLVRLDRYERRAWSRQKRAINHFINIKMRNS
jgi:hypothetical protein